MAKAELVFGNIHSVVQLQNEMPFGAELIYSINVNPHPECGTVDCILTRTNGNEPCGWKTIVDDLESAWKTIL